MTDWLYTLLADGPSDARLMPIIDWSIEQCASEAITGQFANPRGITAASRRLDDRIPAALDAFPCDLLIVHRDSETPDFEHREEEIRAAVRRLELPEPPVTVLVPVRMQEAWLLFDEMAIRRAGENPRGRVDLALPSIARLEEVADPKAQLKEALRKASEYTGRRLRRFSEHRAAYRVSQLISDFSPLRRLPAFQRFEDSLRVALNRLGLLVE